MFELSVNSWIVIAVGFLAATACSLLGVFLVLRRMSLTTDAISHAVLPGIAIAFLASGSRDPLPMLVGAGAVGVLTTVLIEWLHRSGRIQSDAAVGVVFTTLFAVGVVLISAKAGMVDLDQECVLYGEIAYSPWDELLVGGSSWGPRPLWVLGFMTLVNALFVLIFYKELKLSTFDPALATTLGFSAGLLHYALMALTSLTTVAAFESVGAILVVAMFVVPAATAYILSDRLGVILPLTVLLAAVTAPAGYLLARALDASVAGAMTTVAGGLFALALLFAPKRGLTARWWGRAALRLRIAAEDWTASLYRAAETTGELRPDLDASRLATAGWLPLYLRLKGLAHREGGEWQLTTAGGEMARRVIRRHRSWEGYLHDEYAVPEDHVHRPAHDAEHFLDEDVPDSDKVMAPGRRDPHGSRIPE